ncbi:MAG: transposase [Planctomycetota bacterium]
MLLKVLIYCYCTEVFSSRKIARNIEDSVAFRYLSDGNEPSYRTICRFRQEPSGDLWRSGRRTSPTRTAGSWEAGKRDSRKTVTPRSGWMQPWLWAKESRSRKGRRQDAWRQTWGR